MNWTKNARDQWICQVELSARFTLKAFPKGDGRWQWEIFSGDAEDPMATGIVGSLGAAKNVTKQFLRGAGYT